jgi:excisionase family DNA binding protein
MDRKKQVHTLKKGPARTMDTGPITDRLLSVAEVAQRLHVHVTWVYQQSLAGTLPSRKIGRYLRFDPAEVDAYVEAAPRGAKAGA